MADDWRFFGDEDDELDGATLSHAMRQKTKARPRSVIGLGDAIVVLVAGGVFGTLLWWLL